MEPAGTLATMAILQVGMCWLAGKCAVLMWEGTLAGGRPFHAQWGCFMVCSSANCEAAVGRGSGGEAKAGPVMNVNVDDVTD